MSTKFKITLDLWLEREALKGDEKDDKIEDFHNMLTRFDPAAHLRKYKSKEFAGFIIGHFGGYIVSSRWLKGTKIQFICEFREPVTKEHILKYLMKANVDKIFSWTEIGWIVLTHRGYRYGVYDYRRPDCIAIEEL
jgi:hypothetical protein